MLDSDFSPNLHDLEFLTKFAILYFHWISPLIDLPFSIHVITIIWTPTSCPYPQWFWCLEQMIQFLDKCMQHISLFQYSIASVWGKMHAIPNSKSCAYTFQIMLHVACWISNYLILNYEILNSKLYSFSALYPLSTVLLVCEVNNVCNSRF